MKKNSFKNPWHKKIQTYETYKNDYNDYNDYNDDDDEYEHNTSSSLISHNNSKEFYRDQNINLNKNPVIIQRSDKIESIQYQKIGYSNDDTRSQTSSADNQIYSQFDKDYSDTEVSDDDSDDLSFAIAMQKLRKS